MKRISLLSFLKIAYKPVLLSLMVIVFLQIPVESVGQQKKLNEFNTSKTHKKLTYSPSIGVSWQSTVFKPIFDFSHIYELGRTPFPINYEKGIQGFGLNINNELKYALDYKNKIAFLHSSRLRYDYLYGSNEFGHPFNPEIKTFYHSIQLGLGYSRVIKNDRSISLYLAYSINHIGKKRVFDLRHTIFKDSAYVFNFQYPSIDLIIDYDLLRINNKFLLSGALKVNYLPNGIPVYPYRDFMTLGLDLRIKYDRLKQRT